MKQGLKIPTAILIAAFNKGERDLSGVLTEKIVYKYLDEHNEFEQARETLLKYRKAVMELEQEQYGEELFTLQMKIVKEYIAKMVWEDSQKGLMDLLVDEEGNICGREQNSDNLIYV